MGADCIHCGPSVIRKRKIERYQARPFDCACRSGRIGGACVLRPRDPEPEGHWESGLSSDPLDERDGGLIFLRSLSVFGVTRFIPRLGKIVRRMNFP